MTTVHHRLVRLEAALLPPLIRLVLAARDPLVIGITGSVGKTTTKEIVGRVLAHPRVAGVTGSVWRTPNNRNARRDFLHLLLGVPHAPATTRATIRAMVLAPIRALAIALRLRAYPRVLVLEYGTSAPGGIRWRTRFVRPDVGVVTAVGPAHLEHFGSVERIADEKADLVRAVAPDGLVVLGADDRHASAMQGTTSAACVLVPGAGRAFAEAVARLLAERLGAPAAATEAALATAGSVRGRQQVHAAGALTVIDDAFNANPLSMRYGLDQLAAMPRGEEGGRRIAVIGDMLELGPEAVAYHEAIGAQARATSDVVIGVGALARHYAADHWFGTAGECAAALPEILAPGDVVLVKGSHAVGLQVAVRAATQIGASLASPVDGTIATA